MRKVMTLHLQSISQLVLYLGNLTQLRSVKPSLPAIIFFSYGEFL